MHQWTYLYRKNWLDRHTYIHTNKYTRLDTRDIYGSTNYKPF